MPHHDDPQPGAEHCEVLVAVHAESLEDVGRTDRSRLVLHLPGNARPWWERAARACERSDDGASFPTNNRQDAFSQSQTNSHN